MIKQKITLFVLISVAIYSCKVKPKPINYGSDHCYFCDMTIVDKMHASQYTTKKGKSYAFDAIECLIRELNQKNNENKMEFILVADYANLGNLIDANSAVFLVSKKIKSPMSANLSAFSTQKAAIQTQSTYGGAIYTWQQIKEKLH